MSFSVFFNFEGNCREAVEFYGKVFGQEVKNLMTYGETPPMDGYTVKEADRDRIMYASVNICGCDIMFMDIPTDEPLVTGNQISPCIASTDMDEIKRLYHALSEGGVVGMELQKTFWSDLYGMVTDKFGITWNISHDSGRY